MAVVTRSGVYVVTPLNNTAPTGQKRARAAQAGGEVGSLIETVPVTNGDSSTSTLRFGYVPSNAVILPSSRIDNDAVTGVSDFDLGVYKDGVVVDADCLVDGASIASAGILAVPGAVVSNANKPKMLWQLAGLTADPQTLLEIRGTLNANATASGNVTLTLIYASA